MEGSKAAQASAEFLLILAVSMVIIIMIVMLAQQQITTVQSEKDNMDAQNSLLDLSSAARSVYAQGEGSKKLVFIRLPSSYDPSQSSVGNKSISIRAAGTDHVSLEDFNVRGSLPGQSGGQWIWVVSEGNRVRIGTAMLSLSRNSISIVMAPGESDSVSLTAQSLWELDIDVDTELTWSHSEVSATPSVGDFSLSPGGTQPITIDFQADSNSTGYYSGELTFTVTDGNASEEISVPITVAVMSYGLDISPPLNVTPGVWAATLQPTNSTSQVFTICTNSRTSLSGVAFTPSSGAPGSWVNDTGSLGPMGAGTCQLKSMSLTVPNGTAAGTYAGSIDVTGQGAIGAQDTILLAISVPSNGTNATESNCSFGLDNQSLCNCPVGSGYWDIPLCMCKPADIYVMNGIVYGGPDNGKAYNGTLRGGSGIDTIAGTNGSDIILGDESGDIICGLDGDDYIYGGNGDDLIDGGDGNDHLYGESGYDKIYGKEGNDWISGGQGNDQVDGGSGNDEIYGDGQDDLLYGGPGADTIYGGENKDTICGNADNDIIDGGGDADTIDGGTGTNTLNGGGGNNDCYRGPNISNCTTKSGYYATCGPS